jgi:hypothetical protein
VTVLGVRRDVWAERGPRRGAPANREWEGKPYRARVHCIGGAAHVCRGDVDTGSPRADDATTAFGETTPIPERVIAIRYLVKNAVLPVARAQRAASPTNSAGADIIDVEAGASESDEPAAAGSECRCIRRRLPIQVTRCLSLASTVPNVAARSPTIKRVMNSDTIEVALDLRASGHML